jgi:mannosyltransferase
VAPHGRRFETQALVAALTLATAGVSFLRLGSRSIWGDEAISISYALKSFGGLHESILGDPNMALYYGALWAWAHLFGDDLIVLKSLSVLFAALTVPVVYLLGARLFGRRAGLAAALLLAVNTYFLTYAQTARGYSLVTLLVSVSMLCFVEALERPSPRVLAGYAVASALAYYAHFFSAYVILVQVAVLAAVKRREALTSRWFAAYAGLAVLIAPITYQAVRLGRDPIGYITAPGWHTLSEIARSVAGNSAASAIAVVVVITLALPTLVRSRNLHMPVALVGAWLVAPTLVAFLVSQVHPMLEPRYVALSVPALALLAGAAVAGLRPPVAGAALGAVLVLLAAHPLWSWYHRPGPEDWKGVSAYLLDRAEPADGVAYEMSRALPAIGYYQRGRGSRTTLTWGKRRGVLPPAATRRVWLLRYPSAAADPLEKALRARGLRARAGRDFHGSIRVVLFSRS